MQLSVARRLGGAVAEGAPLTSSTVCWLRGAFPAMRGSLWAGGARGFADALRKQGGLVRVPFGLG